MKIRIDSAGKASCRMNRHWSARISHAKNGHFIHSPALPSMMNNRDMRYTMIAIDFHWYTECLLHHLHEETTFYTFGGSNTFLPLASINVSALPADTVCFFFFVEQPESIANNKNTTTSVSKVFINYQPGWK